MVIDTAQLVHDTLIEAYARVRGESPEGQLMPDEAVVRTLERTFRDKPPEALIQFVQLAMFAHMSRTETTRTPFFVNTMLLATSSIAYMEKHKKYLRSFYGSGSEPLVFEQQQYGSFVTSEQDYLDTFGNSFVRSGKLPDLSILTPTPLWILWSVELKRFGKSDYPAAWNEQRVSVSGIKQACEQAIAIEHGKLAKDSIRREAARSAVDRALRDAALNWAARFHAVRLLYDDGKSFAAPDSAIDVKLLEPDVPLRQRDLDLFAAVRDHAKLTLPPPRERKAWRGIPGNLRAVASEVGKKADE